MPMLPYGYHLGERGLRGLYAWARRGWTALGLGLLSDADLELLDGLHYRHDPLYHQAAHIEAGLWDWERAMLEGHGAELTTLTILGAGSGREALALAAGRWSVRAFETQAELRELGNRFLAAKGLALRIEPMPYSGFPESAEASGGIMLGWGLYSGIRGRANRLNLLAACRRNLAPGGILFLSYLLRYEPDRGAQAALAVANGWRRLLGRPLCEPGDTLAGGFLHYFAAGDVEAELRQAGFAVVGGRAVPYPHLAARAEP